MPPYFYFSNEVKGDHHTDINKTARIKMTKSPWHLRLYNALPSPLNAPKSINARSFSVVN